MKNLISILKSFFLISFLIAASTVIAKQSNKNKISPTEFRKLYFTHQLKKTGGIIREEGSAKGVFVILNSQSKIPSTQITIVNEVIDKWIRIKTTIKNVKKIDDVQSEIAKAGGTLGVAIIDSSKKSSLIVAPEDGWAIVNIKQLNIDNPSSEILASRVRKEILRAFAFITGGAYTTKADPLMRDVKEPQDLDGLTDERFGLEIVTQILQSAPFYGLTPWNQTTYIKACEEGWAPAPTNEYQQAIWDRVHAAPKNPMKIEFDPKKGR